MNGRRWDILDLLSVLSFLIGLVNLDENLTQGDIQAQTAELDEKFSGATAAALAELHAHLEAQDARLDELALRLEAFL